MNKCEIVKASEENLEVCGELIRNGKLVAFPTETVYGLGAHALDIDAVLKIFQTKNRPLTDPLIVHVASIEQAYPLIDASEAELFMFQKLASRFWPGPLTMILKASKLIPPEITAQTGFIGIRIPNHKLALSFLKACNVPVAAPSANLFNHISPTTAAHVFNDFFDKDLQIIEDGNSTLGIESTVMKITEKQFNIFRLGSLPKREIEDFISSDNLFKGIDLIVTKKIMKESEQSEAPGQFIKHYAPIVDSFVIWPIKEGSVKSLTGIDLTKTVLLDFGKVNTALGKLTKAYLNLSEEGDVKEAMFKFYYLLREAECIDDIDSILITDIEHHKEAINSGNEYLESLFDKIYRSCSGRKVYGGYSEI
jgi:L-threonylcarbamoyladenylate synthase